MSQYIAMDTTTLNADKILNLVEQQMPVLHNVMRETLRLYPLGAAFSRTPVQSIHLDKYLLPSNAKVLNIQKKNYLFLCNLSILDPNFTFCVGKNAKILG